jgi:hypothetical protein
MYVLTLTVIQYVQVKKTGLSANLAYMLHNQVTVFFYISIMLMYSTSFFVIVALIFNMYIMKILLNKVSHYCNYPFV